MNKDAGWNPLINTEFLHHWRPPCCHPLQSGIRHNPPRRWSTILPSFLPFFLPSFLSPFAKAIFHPRSKTLRHLLESSSIREYSVAERRQKAVVGELARYTRGTVSGRGRGPRPTGWSYRFSCVPTRFKPTLRTLFRSKRRVVCSSRAPPRPDNCQGM